MARLERPRGLTINFKPSERQLELWNALKPNCCDKCGGKLVMKHNGFDAQGHKVYQATCEKCGNTDIPEQILGGGSAGGGKALLLNELVCTPFGFRRVGDLKVDDIISNPRTGKQQRVTWVHPIEKHGYYRVEFVDGTYTDCSEGHLWQLHEAGKITKRKKLGSADDNEIVWSTKKMYNWMENKKKGMYKGRHLIIPLTEPVQFTRPTTPTTPRPLHPYILGALLGDGCMGPSSMKSKYIPFYTPDQFIVDKFKECGYDMSSVVNKDKKCKTYLIRNQNIVEAIKVLKLDGCLANSKFIPEVYKFGTIEERKQLMRGLMDTDGYVDDRGHMSYTTVSGQLANDVAFVCRSLGAKCTITSDIGQYRDEDGVIHKCQTAYTVYIMSKFDRELVSLPKKLDRAKNEFNGGVSQRGKAISDIIPLGIQEGRCISVSDPMGLFITNDFTVTHNSYIGCCWLTLSCMQFEGIRMVVARKVRKTLLETTWVTLNNVLKEWGLVRDVHYHINNLAYTITFWNGSEIMAMDLTPVPSDPDFNSLGSLEITGGFIDEVSEVSEKAVEVLASRIRYKIAETFVVGKLFMSTNPALTWIRSTFVMDDDGNPVTLPAGYRYIPFSLFDNPNESFRAVYYNKLKKLRNKADRDRLLYGNWLFTTSNKMAAYWHFDGDKHIFQNVKKQYYDKLKPLILSFDFNVNPYMSCLPMQIDFANKVLYVFPEYVGYPKDKHNNTPAFTRWIASQLVCDGHVGGVLLTGDPAGLARSTQTEEGTNNFTIASKNLSSAVLSPKTQILSKQPAHTTRLEFVNEVLNGYDGWQVKIDARCHRLVEDFVYQKKNPDGTKEKKKVLNDNGDRVERYGHFSDCFDYAIVYYLNKEYSTYKTINTEIVTTIDVDESVYGDFDY